MNDTSTYSSGKITCNLVNHFQHDHELLQYKEIRDILLSDTNLSGIDGVLLGNPMCSSASLDSLLLTPFGVYIIEFKDYHNVKRVRINGQREFVCLYEDGNPMKDKEGNPLTVKGGCSSSPFEQARINRRIVREKLIRVFGATVGNSINLGVIIVFRGKTRTEGINEFSSNEQKWLSIINTSELEPLLSVASLCKSKGLDASQRTKLISCMDADRDLLPATIRPTSSVRVSTPVSTVRPTVTESTKSFSPTPSYEYSEKQNKLTDEAKKSFRLLGRLANTTTFVIFLLFQIVMLIPGRNTDWIDLSQQYLNLKLLIVLAGLGIFAYLINWCIEEEDFDHWFIRRNPHNHIFELTFRTIEVRNKDWDSSRSALVVSYVIVVLIILAAPFAILNHFMDKGMLSFAGSHFGSRLFHYVFDHTEAINIFTYIKGFMWTYFLIHYAGYLFSIWHMVTTLESHVYVDAKCSPSRYLIPVPVILDKSILRCAWKIACRSFSFALWVTAALVAITILRIHLYPFIF